VNRAAALAVNCPSLADYRLFANPSVPTANPNEGGLAYELTTPLFSDYAQKNRFIFLPPGTSAGYDADSVLNFPVGTIISKTFSFSGIPVETRLLIHRESGWVALPYLWATDLSQATLAIGGAERDIVLANPGQKPRTIHYGIPNTNKCTGCHGTPDGLSPIGPKARYLNRDNQLEAWAAEGKLTGLPTDTTQVPRVPAWNDPHDGTLEQRARGYLEINCAHCHNPEGRARFSGLYLEYFRDATSTAAGTCKPPIAAGAAAGNLKYDIVPGKAKQSIIHFRLHSESPAIRMPQLGRTVVHREGLALVDQWINSRKYEKCGN
jgi:uncharacterized repeat protein (TIGR03806 family)